MENTCHLYQKNITLEQAMLGGNFRIQVNNGQTIRVKLKPGSFSGQVIRLKALQGSDSNLTNDTYIELKVLDHPLYRVDGLNLRAPLVVTPAEAETGSVKKITMPSGKKINVDVKPKSQQNDEIVVEEAGLSDKTSTGDVIFNLKIDFLDTIDEAELIQNISGNERILN